MNIRRRLALSYYRAKGYFPAKLYGRRYRLVPEDRKFWRTAAGKKWERFTFMFLERCLRADSVYVDVGAWIGPTVLFAAPRCRMVYCIEPDPVAYERLLANLRMNDVRNVRPFHGALGSQNGRVQIAGHGGFGHSGFGHSTTRVQGALDDDGVAVLAMDIQRFIECWGIDKIDVLKMDIEGAEFDLAHSLIEILPTHKPTIHLSLHAPFFAQSERQDKLAAIVQLAERYAFCYDCYDQGLNRIQPGDILKGRFVSRCAVVVLADTAL